MIAKTVIYRMVQASKFAVLNFTVPLIIEAFTAIRTIPTLTIVQLL